VYPFLRILFHNPRNDSPIDLHTINKVLFLRYDRIGDMIVTTPIFRSLKKAYPAIKIGVFASNANAEIIKFNPHVDIVHVLTTHWWQIYKEIRKSRKENYDVVLHLIFNRTSSGGILANLISPKGIKIGQGAEKYRFYFNRLLHIKADKQHIVKTQKNFMKESFGIDVPISECNYEIFINDETKSRVQVFCNNNGLRTRSEYKQGYKPYIIFNLSASNQWTKLSIAQVEAITRHLGTKKDIGNVIIYDPLDHEMQEFVSTMLRESNVFIFPRQGTATLLELASLIEGSCCVITPDTSIVHFASAMHTPVLAFYSSYKENHEWLPHQVKNRVVISAENEPTSAIPVSKMISAIDGFMNELDNDFDR
jgi:ADP-heptose:LPS heptosyltransferase